METSILNPSAPILAGQFERYVRELCNRYVAEQLREISQIGNHGRNSRTESFLTKQEAARLIGKGEKMIDNYRKKGLPTHMFGRTPMFLESEIISFLDTYNRKSHIGK